MFKRVFTCLLVPYLSILTVQKGYSQGPPPNIVLILADDMGYYDLSCYGATEVKTNQINKLAEEGIRFTDYYAAAPICSPSRAGLLSGCYPRRVGNHIWVHRPDSDYGLNPDELTMAELFKQNGFKTACIGKWHLGFKEPFLPQQQGFDYYFGILHNLDSPETVQYRDRGGIPVIRNGQVVSRPADPAQLTRLYTDEAIHWIESCVESKGRLKQSDKAGSKNQSEPFFLYLPYTTLHNPLGVSDAFVGTSNWGVYGDAIQELDYHIGRLMDKLRDLDIADNTIVIYMSDNGRGPGRNANQPIRGGKLSTLEGGLRVPCIVWGPGLGIPKGLTTKVLAYAMDWYPMLASLAGIKIPDRIVLDGRDLSRLITGKTDEISYSPQNNSLNATIPLRRYWNPGYEWSKIIDRNEYLNAFFYHGAEGALSAVRSGKWKLFLNPELTLYNLETDPGERIPIENKEIKSKLRGMAILFQEEMRLFTRTAGQVSSTSNGLENTLEAITSSIKPEHPKCFIKKGDVIDIKKGHELEEDMDLIYSTIGDISLKLDLYRPKQSGELLPAVVCIHGGGWSKGNRKGFANIAKALANNGFAAVTIDYRLSDVAAFPAQIQDCKAAVRWLRLNADKYGIDASRIGALGHSAGGHLAALLATSAGCSEIEAGIENSSVSSRITSAVAMGAQTDFLSERTKEVSLDLEWGQIWRQFLGGSQVEKPEVYRLASPLNHLDEKDPPIAFLTGEFDDSSTHADKFREKAEKMGIVTRFAIIENAPHNFLTDPAWFDLAISWSVSFFRDNLK